MSTPKKLIFLMAAAIVAIGAGGWYALRFAGGGDDALRVSGNIETVEVAISFKIPGRVDKRYVDEGEPVYEGKPVAQLETADLEADAALARAQLQAAQANYDELKKAAAPRKSPPPWAPCRRPRPITTS